MSKTNTQSIISIIIVFFTLTTYCACTQLKSEVVSSNSEAIRSDLPWSEKMALSIMKRNDRLYMVDSRKDPKWSYVYGLVAQSFIELYEQTGDEDYYLYAKGYADDMINSSGEILGYKITDFNIDNINPGKFLFDIYEREDNDKYLTAIHTLRNQIEWQPRNTEGGFWHKLRYPWQMWLDGLYMGAPFYARYERDYGETKAFDDIVKQFKLLEKNAKDANNGLYYHGWDESKIQKWSDSETGLSPHFWSRAIGWYAMALVDVLDYIPTSYPERSELINILQDLMHSVEKFQDEETGLWYQVMNLPNESGNYLEATSTCMFSYVMLKGVRLGYLDKSFYTSGSKAHAGLVNELIKVDESGEIHLTKCCAVAGLGGDPFRDGSYEYYINETVIDNDPKGTGPFILASLELERSTKNIK